MQNAPIPANDRARLANLKMYQVLDTLPEEAFDSITRFAASQFQVPIALISLVDERRQWFKSCQGLGASETGRDESFCGHAILAKRPFIVENALLDRRFADNPLVTGEPHIRFYAGAPLISPEGFALGTLCLIDNKPRTFSSVQIAELEELANRVVARLKLRLANLYLQKISEKQHPIVKR